MSRDLEPTNLFSQKIYWINQLSGELPETNLMLDYVRPLVYSGKNQSFSFKLTKDLSQAIIKLSKGSYLSIYIILISTLNIFLQKYTGNYDVIIGIPLSDKIAKNGINSKILPLRNQVTPEISFKDFLFQAKSSIIGAYSHQNYDFDELIKLLEIPKNPNRSAIYDIVILLENIHSQTDLTELNNDITISFKADDKIIIATIEYSEQLFQAENIRLMSRYYINLLENIINNIDTKISDIALLQNNDKQQLLKEYNNKVKEYPVEQTINELFEKQVSQSPNNIAVIHQQTKLTYQELNNKANQLAEFLRKLGVRKGEFLGIFKDRDINFLIAILAIYKAGGAYVPIDSTYPPNRIKYMLSNSEVRFIATDYSLINLLPSLVEDCLNLESIICLDDILSDQIKPINETGLKVYNKLAFDNLTINNIQHINDANDPAYMLYTSGSTGLPKGAIVRHDGAVNHIYAQFDELHLNPDFCFLQSAPASTDISVWQFLAPLLIGGKTVIVDIETVAIPDKLFKVLKSEKITVVELVPALFGSLLEYTFQLPITERELPDLKWMMVVGESVSVSWVNKWLKIYPSIKIVNAYGPTEAADDITQFIVDKPFDENQRTVPIGKPLANLNLYILDKQMQLLPIGAAGEICVSGIGVGDGYWKNQEKTNLSFVPNPFTDASQKLPGNRKDLIYKTGDLGRWLPDGNIEFLGRIDHQVKIRGFRIELGEIEMLLSQHPAVSENVVVVREDIPGDKRLIAYIVPSAEYADFQESLAFKIYDSELRSYLKGRLPDYMLPSTFMLLESLPLTPSGKLDRRALPQPDDLRPELETTYVMPRNDVERIIAEVWQNALNIKKVGIQDNFFDIGGHSLNVLQVYSKLRELLKANLAITDLFKYPTISSLSQYFSQGEKPDEAFAAEGNELNQKLEAGKARFKQRLVKKQHQNIEII